MSWGHGEAPPRCDFRVMSFNVLAEAYCYEQFYPHLRRDFSLLSWKNRREPLRRLIESLECHVVCLQEVDHSEMLQELREYDFRQLRRGGHKPDHEAILWRRDAFCCCDELEINFDFELGPALGQHRVALVLALIPHDNEAQLLVIANCHLDYKSEACNEAQSAFLRRAVLRMAARLSKLHRRHPCVIVTGDFNTALDSRSAAVMMGHEAPRELRAPKGRSSRKPKGGKGKKGKKAKQKQREDEDEDEADERGVRGPPLASAYPTDAGYASAYMSRRSVMIDHMFYFQRGAKLVAHRRMPPMPEPLPNEEHPSDHLPIACAFDWVKK